MNISKTVIIPTAGLGNRMGSLTKNLNKALLPYKNKPVISHIIENFPKDYKFLIILGYLSDQVKDYIITTYSDRNIEFVEVDDYTSQKSGTAYSLKFCKSIINTPFWYVPCDTYFEECVFELSLNDNVFYVKEVPQNISHLYTMMKVEHDKIVDLTFKQTNSLPYKAFTGLMYIHHWEVFFKELQNLENNEFIFLIKKYSQVKDLNSWLDFGDQNLYQLALSKSQKFDFTKKDEITYISNDKTIKWSIDNNILNQKLEKYNYNVGVFPNNCKVNGNFLAYDFVPGKTLYQFNNPVAFNELLYWLDKNLWTKDSKVNIYNECNIFYKNKTLSRINMFLDKYEKLQTINYIDGVPVKDYSYYLNKIDWEFLSSENIPGFIHGDLQFDNIILDDSGNFKLIDWRSDFAGLTKIGDIYYDLAKLYGGLILNYADVKNHHFDFEIDNDNAILSVPNIDYFSVYENKLIDYIKSNNYSLDKIYRLIPIIYWNMAPLHVAPFDQFLWILGIKLFEKVL